MIFQNIQQLSRLQQITSQTKLIKQSKNKISLIFNLTQQKQIKTQKKQFNLQKKIININSQNRQIITSIISLQSSIQFFIQINYLAFFAIKKNYSLYLTKSIYIKNISKRYNNQKQIQCSTVYSYYYLKSQHSNTQQNNTILQNVLNKYSKQLLIFNDQSQKPIHINQFSQNQKQKKNPAKLLLDLNVQFYSQLNQTFTIINNQKAKEQYNKLMQKLWFNQKRIKQGQISIQQIIQWMEASPLFYQFSITCKMKNTLLGLRINLKKKNSLCQINARQQQLQNLKSLFQQSRCLIKNQLSADKMHFQKFLQQFRKEVSKIFTFLASANFLSIQLTTNSQGKSLRYSDKTFEKYYFLEQKQSDKFRKKFGVGNLINFSIRMNQGLFKQFKQNNIKKNSESVTMQLEYSNYQNKSINQEKNNKIDQQLRIEDICILNLFQNMYNQQNLKILDQYQKQNLKLKPKSKSKSKQTQKSQIYLENLQSQADGLQKSFLYSINLAFQIYIYKQQSTQKKLQSPFPSNKQFQSNQKIQQNKSQMENPWYLSILLKIPFYMTSFQALHFEKVWEKMEYIINQESSVNLMSTRFFEDPISKQHFLHQKIKISNSTYHSNVNSFIQHHFKMNRYMNQQNNQNEIDRSRLLLEIIKRTDQLLIFYFAIEPLIQYFSRECNINLARIYNVSYKKQDWTQNESQLKIEQYQKMLQRQKKNLTNDQQISKISKKIVKALKIYKRKMEDKQFNQLEYAI